MVGKSMKVFWNLQKDPKDQKVSEEKEEKKTRAVPPQIWSSLFASCSGRVCVCVNTGALPWLARQDFWARDVIP